MSEPIGPPPPPTSDHTEWVWVDGFGWVDREKPQPPPAVIPPRPDDTAEVTWELGADGWLPRPWTAEELAVQAAEADRRAARESARAIIADLRAEKDRAQAVIDNPNATAREKDLGRSVKRIADAVIDLARLVV